jgi:hypothetical protein
VAPITIEPALVNLNISSLSDLRNLPWNNQSALNRTINIITSTTFGPEQFEASLSKIAYEASRPMFIRNRFLPVNATEEYYYQRIAQISDDVVVYQRIKGYVSNPLQHHICIVFKGSSTNYDFWTDFNIIAEPLTGTSVFQQQIDSTVLNLTGMLSGLTLSGNTISFIGHSLGFHKSEAVLYKLLENNVLDPATTTILQYGFSPLIWNDSNHQLITLAVAQAVSGSSSYAKYLPIANNTSIYCVEGDYVSLLQKVDWVGYGDTYVRPNITNNLITSTVDFYTNGILTESINHTIDNYIDGVNKLPDIVEETPSETQSDSTGQSYIVSGNNWFITNALNVQFTTYNQKMSLESDSLGTNINVNLYHDSDPDDLQYRWTFTKDSSIANAIIYSDLGSYYIAFTYTISNTTGFTRTVRFRKDSHIPSGTTRDYYLIEDVIQNLYLQIKTNPTDTTIDHIAGWGLSAPLPSLSTIDSYTNSDDLDRSSWYLSHFTTDKQRETGWVETNDDLRRRLYPVSITQYVVPWSAPVIYTTSNSVVNFVANYSSQNVHGGNIINVVGNVFSDRSYSYGDIVTSFTNGQNMFNNGFSFLHSSFFGTHTHYFQFSAGNQNYIYQATTNSSQTPPNYTDGGVSKGYTLLPTNSNWLGYGSQAYCYRSNDPITVGNNIVSTTLTNGLMFIAPIDS